jgi:predicted dehydrogenase
MSEARVNVAIVGLGFGAEFIPIYQRHPRADLYAICQRTRSRLDEVGEAFGVARRFTDFDELLADRQVDAVHINTPIHEHAPMAIAALRAGKHVACTVPAATSIEELEELVAVQAGSGRTYMMMETTVYSREFLFVQELARTGKMGRIQYLRATHQQEMLGWPGYWEGLPPMYYATHVVGPCLALVEADARSVTCHGSGRIQEHLIPRYGSPFAVESASIEIHGSDVVAEVMRSLFNTARQYRESFEVYGSRMSFEWPIIEGTPPVVHVGEVPHLVSVLDYAHLLPDAIAPFTTKGAQGGERHLSFIQGAGHGGSHPHLVHEFVNSIAEDREPFPDVRQAANWTAVGILAHDSAMHGGEARMLPEFTLSR